METTTISSGSEAVTVSRLCFGTIQFGTGVDKQTAFALLDRFREAGGTFLDTANNYNAWAPDGHGRDSEDVLGTWLADRAGARDEMIIATKAGAGKADPALPLTPANFEGLDPTILRRELVTSLEHLGLDRVGVFYGHVDDRKRSAAEIAESFAVLAEEGLLVVPGMSNTVTWRLAQMRDWAASTGRPAIGAWQQEGTVLWPRPGADQDAVVSPEGVDYAASASDLTLLPYSPQQGGLFARPWVPLGDVFDHPGSHARIRAVHRVAHELGATANQVVLSMLMEGSPRMVPIFGASTLEQLDEAIGSVEVHVPAELRAQIDRV